MHLRFTKGRSKQDRANAARAAAADPESGVALLPLKTMFGDGVMRMVERVVDEETRKPLRGEKLDKALEPYLPPSGNDFVFYPLLRPVVVQKPKPKPAILGPTGEVMNR